MRPPANVLVVDDEEQIRRLVGLILQRFVQRFEVHATEAQNAEEALAILEHAEFDLIISDYSMPGKTGIDLLAHAHGTHPRTARMLITALGQLDIGVEAINRGKVDAFLRKPWDNPAFVALVESLLERRVALHDVPAPPVAAAGVDVKALEAEKEELDRQIGQLRVRLGLGSLSPEGYRKLASELGQRRASIEVQLLKLRAASA